MFQSKFEHVVEENKKLQKIIADLKSVNRKLRLDDDKKLLIVFLTVIGSAIMGVVAYSYNYFFTVFFVKENLEKFKQSFCLQLYMFCPIFITDLYRNIRGKYEYFCINNGNCYISQWLFSSMLYVLFSFKYN